MQNLITIKSEVIGNAEVNSVNARDLWKALEIKKEFANWIKSQINTLGFEKNVDYSTFAQKVKRGENTNLSTTRKEYIITIDTAKHISMASRTAKGKEVRDYFISCERKLLVSKGNNEVFSVVINQNETMLKLLSTQTKLLEQLVNKEESKPKTITKEQMKKIRSNSIILCSLILDLSPDKNESEVMRRLYTELNARFGVSSYYDIAKDDYGEVISFQEKAITRWEKKKELLEEKLNDEDLVIKIL